MEVIFYVAWAIICAIATVYLCVWMGDITGLVAHLGLLRELTAMVGCTLKEAVFCISLIVYMVTGAHKLIGNMLWWLIKAILVILGSALVIMAIQKF